MLSGDTKVLAPAPNDNHATGTWYKFYQNKLNIWTWQTSNKDNDPRSLSWNLTPGVYWIQISMRSKGCAIDKIALWNKAKHALANAATGNSTVAQNNALNALALSQRKFWDRYVVNDPGISSNLDFAVATQKNFKISQISNGNYEAENPFSDPFSIKIINMNGQVIKEEKGINQAVYNFSITANTSVIAIFMVSNGLRTYSQKIVIQ